MEYVVRAICVNFDFLTWVAPVRSVHKIWTDDNPFFVVTSWTYAQSSSTLAFLCVKFFAASKLRLVSMLLLTSLSFYFRCLCVWNPQGPTSSNLWSCFQMLNYSAPGRGRLSRQGQLWRGAPTSPRPEEREASPIFKQRLHLFLINPLLILLCHISLIPTSFIKLTFLPCFAATSWVFELVTLLLPDAPESGGDELSRKSQEVLLCCS